VITTVTLVVGVETLVVMEEEVWGGGEVGGVLWEGGGRGIQ
jgi:hypothetical protein